MGWTALIDEDNKEIGIVGDPSWDLASIFVDKMMKLYMRNFGIPAKLIEIQSSIEFVYSVCLEEANKNG